MPPRPAPTPYPTRPGARSEIETIKYRKPPKPTLGYLILNAIFSTLIFVFIYFFYIVPRPRDLASFALLFGLNIAAGWIGSMIARMFTMNFDGLLKTTQVINRTLISSLIYSLVVFFGLFTFITARYIDLNNTTVAAFLVYLVSRDFLEIVAILLGFKLLIYLFSDFISDKTTFGG